MSRVLPVLLSSLLLLLVGCQQQQQQGWRTAYTPRYVYRAGYTATLTRSGRAVAPRYAPARVKRAIAAANKIVGKPYRRGGGHVQHVDSAYDCSGATAFVLSEAGMMIPGRHPTSGDFLKWGRAGFGKWITVYAKQGHVFLMIAGLRFDATGTGHGPRWYKEPRPCSGFKVRYVPGY